MKVLFFLHKIGPYHHARFKELSKNIELTAVEILPDSKEYNWEDIKNITEYKTIKISEHFSGKELKRNKLIQKIKQIVNQEQPNVIITMGWNNRTYFATLYIAKKLGIPICTLSDSIYIHKRRIFVLEFLKKIVVKSYDAFLVAGTRSKVYLNTLDINDGIFTPMDVVDNKYFKNFSTSEKLSNLPENYLLCISRFIKEKNLFSLIRAFSLFKNKFNNDFVLLLVGSGHLQQLIQTEVQKLNAESFIHIHPFVQYSQLPVLYKNAIGLILPSIRDQWGLVVNEAMASGLPLIVSNRCGCIDDLVQDGINGFIIEPTESGILNGLEKFNSLSENERINMGRKGQEIIYNFDLKDYRIGTLSMIDYAVNHEKKINLLTKLIILLRLYF